MPRQKYPWSAADKVRWLGDLARAIDEAQQIVWRLSLMRGDDPHTSQLYGQLESARDEVERLQRGAGQQAQVRLEGQWHDLMSHVSICAAAVD